MRLWPRKSSQNNPSPPSSPREVTLDQANKFILRIIQSDDYKPLLDNTLALLDNKNHILPPITDESPSHNRERKINLISIAINAIHETQGRLSLINEESTHTIFREIEDQLAQMNSDARNASRWARMVTAAADTHIDRPGLGG